MYRHNVSIGWSKVEVNAWTPEDGLRYGVQNWSLRPIQSQKDVEKHHALANGLRAALSSIGAQRVYAPSIDAANGAVISSAELMKNQIRLNGIALYRNQEFPADGTFLEPCETLAASAAGCPFIIANDKMYKNVVVAHAGRDSLVERSSVIGKPSRKHVSVVYSIIEALKERGARAGEISMCMLYCIPVEVFEHRLDHPQYGSYNRELGKFVDTLWPGCTRRKYGSVFLDLESLFISQALEVGVRHTWTINSLADFPALAHTYDGKSPSRRNLFVVKRNA